jgi:hypothetical protein
VGTSDYAAGQQSSDRRAADTGTNTGSGDTTSSGITQTLKDKTYQQLDGQKVRASDTLGNLAGAVRGMTQPLRDGGQEQIADAVNKAADGIERWASQLRQQDLDDAVRAVQQFARRQPAMFLGIAFGAGLIAARFLKSSNSRDSGYYRDYDRDYGRKLDTGSEGIGTADYRSPQFGTSAGDIPRVPPDVRSTGEVI